MHSAMVEKNVTPLSLQALALLVASAAGCGGGQAGKAVRPEAPTANQALDPQARSCTDPKDADQPLVIDMPPEERTNLEIAMRGQVAVVSYDCRSLRVLRACHVDGDYGFFGTTLQEKTVRMTSADEVSVNLPISGVSLIAKLGGEFKGGATVDVALLMVGAKRSTWYNVHPSDLKGSCAGASHFVAGAFVGAFAMKQGAQGSVATTAQVFGSGGAASSASDKFVASKVGDADACTKADPMAKSPPPNCTVPIRLELFPILAESEQPPERETDAPAVLATDSCPKGYALSNGKCTAGAASSAHRCAPAKGAECVAQCDLGDGPSCGSAAAAYESGKSGIEKNPAKAFEYAQKGCTMKDADSCDLVGGYKRSGKGTAKDVEGGATIQTNACRAGSSRACRDVGTYFASTSPPDWRLALAYAERACDGGCTPGCADAGKIYQAGNGVPKDPVKANGLFKRGCDGMKPHTGWDSNCSAYAANLQHGEGVAINATEAASYYQRSCDVAGNAYACDGLGQLAQAGGAGYPANLTVAAKYTGKACSAGMQAPCTQLASYLLEGKGVAADKPKAVGLLKSACKKKHQPACEQLKKMGEATE